MRQYESESEMQKARVRGTRPSLDHTSIGFSRMTGRPGMQNTKKKAACSVGSVMEIATWLGRGVIVPSRRWR
jgi:hypothetical protein